MSRFAESFAQKAEQVKAVDTQCRAHSCPHPPVNPDSGLCHWHNKRRMNEWGAVTNTIRNYENTVKLYGYLINASSVDDSFRDKVCTHFGVEKWKGKTAFFAIGADYEHLFFEVKSEIKREIAIEVKGLIYLNSHDLAAVVEDFIKTKIDDVIKKAGIVPIEVKSKYQEIKWADILKSAADELCYRG